MKTLRETLKASLKVYFEGQILFGGVLSLFGLAMLVLGLMALLFVPAMGQTPDELVGWIAMSALFTVIPVSLGILLTAVMLVLDTLVWLLARAIKKVRSAKNTCLFCA